MMRRRPAYSAAFTPEHLRDLHAAMPTGEITADWAWGGSDGDNVRVAVIDSGIEDGHAGIIGPPVAGYVAISEDQSGNPVYDISPHDDLFGHGTACAGIIRAVAPRCQLYSVQVLGRQLAGKGNVFAAGLRWAIENGMHVCNLSLGTTRKDFFATLHELADDAYFNNVILVCAANNMPVPSFPSVYGSVISVACHDQQDPLLYYYNPTPPVEFGAPGIDIRVPWLYGGWLTTSGNSFAAPHITGLVARIVAKHPDITASQVKAILQALAANVAPSTATASPGGSSDGGN